MVAEQPVPTVIVGELVAAKLADHLHQQGRLRGGVQMVIASLNKAVDRKWGVAADSFNDSAGPGWIIDVSDYFDNELLYAIVRSEHGTRSVVAVVDEDEIGVFKKTGQWTTPEAGTGSLSEAFDVDAEVKALAEVHTLASTSRRASPQRQVKSQPGDPRLIVWWEGPTQKDSEIRSEAETPNAMHCTYEEAQGEVMKLLMQGCKVEVWSGVKHPELKVDL